MALQAHRREREREKWWKIMILVWIISTTHKTIVCCVALCMATTIVPNVWKKQFNFPSAHSFSHHTIVTINRTWCGTRCHAQIFFNILAFHLCVWVNTWFHSANATCGWRLPVLLLLLPLPLQQQSQWWQQSCYSVMMLKSYISQRICHTVRSFIYSFHHFAVVNIKLCSFFIRFASGLQQQFHFYGISTHINTFGFPSNETNV